MEHKDHTHTYESHRLGFELSAYLRSFVRSSFTSLPVSRFGYFIMGDLFRYVYGMCTACVQVVCSRDQVHVDILGYNVTRGSQVATLLRYDEYNNNDNDDDEEEDDDETAATASGAFLIRTVHTYVQSVPRYLT